MKEEKKENKNCKGKNNILACTHEYHPRTKEKKRRSKEETNLKRWNEVNPEEEVAYPRRSPSIMERKSIYIVVTAIPSTFAVA